MTLCQKKTSVPVKSQNYKFLKKPLQKERKKENQSRN